MASNALRNAVKLRDIVSVKDPAYGLRGDGATVDTVAAQAAYAATAPTGIALWWPKGTYQVGALTAVAGTLRWYGAGDATIDATSADVTLVPHAGDVEVEGLNFSDYDRVFHLDNVAANAKLRFRKCSFSLCGSTATSGGRVDFNGAICNRNVAANMIEILEVDDCDFDGDDFGVVYRGGFQRARVTNSRFKNMKRMGVMLGDNTGNQKNYRDILVQGCRFKDIISDDATEVEIHAVLCYGYKVIYDDLIVDTCYDINAGTHDSEGLYLKGVIWCISNCIVKDGARGDAYITAKGVVAAIEPEDIVDGTAYNFFGEIYGCKVYSSDDFVATYPHTTISGIYVLGSGVDVHHNQVRGTFNRMFEFNGIGSLSYNRTRGSASYHCLMAVDNDVDDDTQLAQLNGNVCEVTAAGGAGGVQFRVFATTAITVPSVQMNDNTVVLIGAGTLSAGEQAGVSCRCDRTAAGNNTVTFLQTNDNVVQGRAASDIGSALLVVGSTGSGANGGRITNWHAVGNSGDRVGNVHRLDLVTAGDVAYANVADAFFTNVSSRMLSNPSSATTFKARNLRGGRDSEKAGTATITAAVTSVTVTMGIQDTMRPTSLANISVRPTSDNGASTHWWISNLTGDTFDINVDIAPGGNFTFAWEAKNLYYY